MFTHLDVYTLVSSGRVYRKDAPINLHPVGDARLTLARSVFTYGNVSPREKRIYDTAYKNSRRSRFPEANATRSSSVYGSRKQKVLEAGKPWTLDRALNPASSASRREARRVTGNF